MNNVALGLIVGLFAGAIGGYAATFFAPTDTSSDPTTVVTDTGTLDERLARIEDKLDRLESPAMTLRGSSEGTVQQGDEALAKMIAKEVSEDMGTAVRDSVREAWNDMGEPNTVATESIGRRGKKRVPLSEAAAELGLSGPEEDELRQIYDDTIEKAIDIFAGDDGDREEVRRDFEALKADPSQRMVLLGKYMPKLMPKIGDFMALEAERTKRINEAIGPEKARRLSNEFDIEERDPFGLQGNMRIEARGR